MKKVVIIMIIVIIVLIVVGMYFWSNEKTICTQENNELCNRVCKTDDDCKWECKCGCISKTEDCIYKGFLCERPYPDYNYGCKCIDNKCILGEPIYMGTKEVIITTDKTEYNLGENVKITVENKKASPVYRYFNYYIPAIEKFENESWKTISITCSNLCECANYTGINKIVCRAVVPPQYLYSEFQSPLVYIWNQTSCFYENKLCGNDTYEEGTLKPITQGNFKAKFCYWDKEDINLTDLKYTDPNKKKCIEKEFEIK